MALAAIRDALGDGADLIVLPELVVSGYVFSSLSEVDEVAISPDDDVFGSWRQALGGGNALVVGGFVERGSDGHFYNSVAVVASDGILGTYRKIHLWDEEKRWFTPGDLAPPVIDTPFGKLGVLICYDLEFPESARDLALRGADVIAVPTNWPLDFHPVGERPPEMGNAMVNARVNRVFIACCDRVEEERGVRWTGGSCIVGPDGWVLAERADRDGGSVAANIDVAMARKKSVNANNDVLADRRPEFYGSLTEASSS